jgi:hypothetical protein
MTCSDSISAATIVDLQGEIEFSSQQSLTATFSARFRFHQSFFKGKSWKYVEELWIALMRGSSVSRRKRSIALIDLDCRLATKV